MSLYIEAASCKEGGWQADLVVRGLACLNHPSLARVDAADEQEVWDGMIWKAGAK